MIETTDRNSFIVVYHDGICVEVWSYDGVMYAERAEGGKLLSGQKAAMLLAWAEKTDGVITREIES